MSWIQRLVETYENCQAEVGYSNEAGQRPLLPLCHITTQAHIEIVINGEGNFRRARVITDKAEATTIIPSTESSAGRAGSKPEQHPLCDKLQYVAGDYVKYGGSVTSGFAKDVEEPFRNYLTGLTKWADSPYSHSKVISILKYVSKRSVVKDLVEHQLLFVNDARQFAAKDEVERDKNAKDIFSVMGTQPQEDAFVRWIVEDDERESEVWKDRTLWESWIQYYLHGPSEQALCYVTGKEMRLTTNHPRYIRREGDGAKLISANDSSGFTYRGRFTNDLQSAGVGLEASQKAHYALIWLISRQGYRKGDLAVVAWTASRKMVPQPTDDLFALMQGEISNESTAQELALQLKKRIAGYGKQLGSTDNVAVMALDSATPGRLAIIYYRDLTASEFLHRIDTWHESCAWLHHYRSIEVQEPQSGKVIRKTRPFIGAPAPNDIAEAAYGSQIDDKLRKSTVERILPCIVDGQSLPADLVESTVRRATNRAGMEGWEWNKALSIACALFRKYNKENYQMALDPNRTSRDYLYGRLLALADSLEEWALKEGNENRQTNAARLMQRFAERPCSTWRTIELALTPYIARLGGKSRKRQQMIDEVIASFDPDDFISDKRLSGEFLLGYHSQREFLRPSRTQGETPDQDSDEPGDEK